MRFLRSALIVLPFVLAPQILAAQNPPQIDCDELCAEIDELENLKTIYQAQLDALLEEERALEGDALAAALEADYWKAQLERAKIERDIACSGGSVIECEMAEANVAFMQSKVDAALEAFEAAMDLWSWATFQVDQLRPIVISLCNSLDAKKKLKEENCE